MSESGSSHHSAWDSDLEDVPLVLSDSSSCSSSRSTSPHSSAGPNSPRHAPANPAPPLIASTRLDLHQNHQQQQQQQQQRRQEGPHSADGGSARRERRRSSGDGGPAATPLLSLPLQPPPAIQAKPHPLLSLTTPAAPRPDDACDVPPTTRGTKPPPLALFGRRTADDDPCTTSADGPSSPSKRNQQQQQQQQQQQHRRPHQQRRGVRVQLLLPAFEFDVPLEAEPALGSRGPCGDAHGSMVGASVRDAIVRALGVSSAYLRYFEVKELPAGQLPGDSQAHSHGHPADADTPSSGSAEPPSTSRRHCTAPGPATAADSRLHSGGTHHASANGHSSRDRSSGGVCTVAVAVAHSTFTLQTLEGLLGRGARDAAEIAQLKRDAAAKEEAYVLAKVAAAEKAAEVERVRAQQAHDAAQLRSQHEHERATNAALQAALLQLRRDHEALKARLGPPCSSRDARGGSSASAGSSGVAAPGALAWEAGAHLRGVDARLVDALTSLSKPGVLDKMTRIIAHMERGSAASSSAGHNQDAWSA